MVGWGGVGMQRYFLEAGGGEGEEGPEGEEVEEEEGEGEARFVPK